MKKKSKFKPVDYNFLIHKHMKEDNLTRAEARKEVEKILNIAKKNGRKKIQTKKDVNKRFKESFKRLTKKKK